MHRLSKQQDDVIFNLLGSLPLSSTAWKLLEGFDISRAGLEQPFLRLSDCWAGPFNMTAWRHSG